MCGFAGFLQSISCEVEAHNTTNKMISRIIHRGPDDSGIWIDSTQGVALGHRRLSIIDTSNAGHQPMHSSSGNFVIVFNGEIYNHLELRDEIDKEIGTSIWRGGSDTETLLKGIELWGVKETLIKSVGMFAIAVFDKRKSKLTLVRDRFGEKPLYYGWKDDAFIFGSELKAFKDHPNFDGQINHNSIAQFLKYNYVPSPNTIYKNIYKLKPGFLYELDCKSKKGTYSQYWSPTAINEFKSKYNSSSVEESISGLKNILSEAVQQQMRSDVPLGAFLSGGVDSSLIVSLMQEASTKPIKTFSIGFEQKGYNEAEQAKEVANFLGTDHKELYVTADDALKVIPMLPTMYDEPFSDVSQIPTYLVSKLAREDVIVALTGDGGDELFCGYNRYVLTNRYWKALTYLPLAFRKVLSFLLKRFNPNTLDILNYLLPKKYQLSNLGIKLHKAARVLSALDSISLYKKIITNWNSPEKIVLGLAHGERKDIDFEINDTNNIESMMLLDTLHYLPDDILTKIDRASMMVSLEGRVPFLNHHVYEYAWSLPLELKLKNGISKWCLRNLLYRYVPKELIDKPKMGFSVPISSWLRGPLREWADTLINEHRLVSEGIFDPQPIRRMWHEHLSEEKDWSQQLWSILMFQAWYEANQ